MQDLPAGPLSISSPRKTVQSPGAGSGMSRSNRSANAAEFPRTSPITTVAICVILTAAQRRIYRYLPVPVEPPCPVAQAATKMVCNRIVMTIDHGQAAWSLLSCFCAKHRITAGMALIPDCDGMVSPELQAELDIVLVQEVVMNGRMTLVVFISVLGPALAAGQSPAPQEPTWISHPKVEIIGSIAAGHLFRFDDRGYGTNLNAGVGVEVPVWRGLRAGAEVNTTFGLSPSAATCGGIYPAPGQPAYPCTGFARDGVSGATEASFTAGYFFGHRRLQPYVLGGVSLLRTEQNSVVYIVQTDHVEIKGLSSNTTGIGLTLGAGLRAAVTRRLSIRPEFRYSDGTGLSSANMSQIRLSLGLGYSW